MVLPMIRLFNDNLGRALHAALFHRLHTFCVKHTPEFPAEIAVNNWLSRLYQGDTSIHILVELDDKYNITDHSLAEVSTFLNIKVIHCHQTQHDKSSITAMSELMEYLDKLAEYENASSIIFSVANSKHARAFEKRYGYQTLRTVLIKTPQNDETETDG
jgi:hypothetical protein